jgi:hypothetical protein
MPLLRLLLPLALLTSSVGACGDDDDDNNDQPDDQPDDDPGDAPSLDDFLPDIPPPTGDDQAVYAGDIDAGNADSELIPGQAASGTVGDFYLRNDRVRFVIQSPERVIGVIPQGGNLVDVELIGPDGPVGEDHFGELSSVYLLGRTCEHDSVEVVQDGSGGGVAAIRATGVSGNNDFINIKGMNLLAIPPALDPTVPDEIACATTYILAPGSSTLEVYWTLFNGGTANVTGPFGALNDSGGNVEVWAPTQSFERLGLVELLGAGEVPVDYAVYQAPGVAYGIIPQHEDPGTVNASLLVSGVSIILWGANALLDLFGPEGTFIDIAPDDGVTQSAHIIVGRDAGDIATALSAGAPEAEKVRISGEVTWDNGDPAAGARVAVFEDVDEDGVIDDDDLILSYIDTDAEGVFDATVPISGAMLLRVDVLDQARSDVVPVEIIDGSTSLLFILDRPVRYDYEIVDDETDQPIPAKLLVIGENPAAADKRVHPANDRFDGLVAMVHAARGSSSIGETPDPPLFLVPNSDYRVLVSHGTEWSVAELTLSPSPGEEPGETVFRLRRVVDTSGYVSSEYHVHSIGSPDSPVEWPTRVATAVADGVEVFASTEHEYVADLQPIVEDMGLEDYVRVMPGIEVTPFAYGHFNAYPLTPLDSPNGGAIDWARGAEGFALTPGEIFDAMVERGAELIQVNHPRTLTAGDFQNFFDRAALTFDYAERAIFGDQDSQATSNEFLRLPPGAALFDLGFNALEVWNGFSVADTNEDGVREILALDVVLRDWFNFTSFGLTLTPLGNSDTHTAVRDPMGMPRTLVAVPDDSAAALADGSVVLSVVDNLTGRGDTPRDLVVTNGPHIRVTQNGASAIGRVLSTTTGQVEFDISVQSPSWAEFDVIEIFANAVPDVNGASTVLAPVKCYVTVDPKTLNPNDPCASAPLPAEQFDVDLVNVGGPEFQRFEAQLTLVLAADDPIHPDGGTGDDAWVVVRARGGRAIYPLLLNELLGEEGVDINVLVTGEPGAVDTLLRANGVPASAFTAPIYLDLDGGGYVAPFAPK